MRFDASAHIFRLVGVLRAHTHTPHHHIPDAPSAPDPAAWENLHAYLGINDTVVEILVTAWRRRDGSASSPCACPLGSLVSSHHAVGYSRLAPSIPATASRSIISLFLVMGWYYRWYNLSLSLDPKGTALEQPSGDGSFLVPGIPGIISSGGSPNPMQLYIL